MKNLVSLSAVLGLLSGVSMAVTTIAEWNYNAGTIPGNASTGTGTTSGAFFPFSSALPLTSGSPNDTNPVQVNGGPNNASAARTGPNPGEASGARLYGVNTSTDGFENITMTWDVLSGFRTSRYYQIFGSTDGVTFLPVSAGTGSIVTGLYGTANVSADGLIDMRVVDGLIDDGSGTGYLHDLSYTFASGAGFDDNPNFAVRIAAIHDPAGSDFVSSFAGTTSADTLEGYIRNTSLGGNQNRYDLVRITGSVVPEPTSPILFVLGAGMALMFRLRR